MHAIAAECLSTGHDATQYLGIHEGVEIDEELARAIQQYVDVVRADRDERGGELLVEKRISLSWLHPDFFGTTDCALVGDETLLTVYDAKFGRGEIVEVARADGRPNLQAGYYALGVLELEPQVELVIVQPRAWHPDGPVRRRTWSRDDIIAVGEELVAAARRTEAPNPEFIPGSHCKFCRAAGTCSALRDYALSVAQLEFDEPELPKPTDLTPEQLGRVLESADVLEIWLTAVRAHAHVVAETTGIPGWKLIAKQGRRKWVDEAKAAAMLTYGFDVDHESIYETRMKSPAQIEKLLAPSDRKSPQFKALCPAVSSGLTLVRASNPRPVETRAPLDFEDFDASFR